jgi:hypothetical protein
MGILVGAHINGLTIVGVKHPGTGQGTGISRILKFVVSDKEMTEIDRQGGKRQ